jgi:hypothetical protein
MSAIDMPWNKRIPPENPPAPPADCSECELIRTKYRGFGPSHNGSRSCESGSIASGGDRTHCSCDTCF